MDAAPISRPDNIAVVLPPREGFSDASFGAVSLSIRDFTYASATPERVHVFGTPCDEPFAHINYQPIEISSPWYLRKRVRYMRGLRHMLTANPPALIEVHNRPTIAAEIARWRIAPVSLYLHNDPQDMEGCKTAAARQALGNQLAGVICVSEYIRTRWEDGQTTPATTHVCPLGLAAPTTQCEKKKQLLFVGRMVPEKGVHAYADALAQCLPSFPEWKGVFVGGKRFAKEALSDYENGIIKSLSPIENQIEWRGFQDHEATMQAFAESAIAVIPSLWEEPFGRIAIEAMSHGCAVITSASGGLADIVAKEALIAKPCNGETLATHMQQLLNNPAMLSDYQQRAKKRAAAFDIADTARHLDDVRSHIMAG